MKSTKLRWVLYEYKGRELVILVESFKTKELAEKTRLKYPEKERRKVGIGQKSLISCRTAVHDLALRFTMTKCLRHWSEPWKISSLC